MMAAARKSKLSLTASTIPVIHHLSSSESDSDDWVASEGRTKRQLVESVTKPIDKLIPDGFLDPLKSLKSKKNPKISVNKNEREHDESGDAKRRFLLKLLQDHNEPKWRKNDIWVKAAWDKISKAFNERFLDVNATKTQLQDRVYQMKKTYKILKQLSELSGLRWDYTKNMLEGPEDVWQKLLHTNKDAKKWYNTPWPYYSACQELFAGKSVNERQLSEADESSQGATTPPVKISQKLNNLQELEAVVDINMNSPQSSFLPLYSTQKTQQKRPSQEPTSTESSVMTKFSTEFKILKRKSDQCSETTILANGETDFSIKTCIEGFYKLNGFTSTDLFKVGRIFKSIENREMFLSLTDEDREFWLRAEIDAD